MKHFYRCKWTSNDRALTLYLGRDASGWIGVKKEHACIFSTPKEARATLASIGGRWDESAKVMRVTVKRKAKP